MTVGHTVCANAARESPESVDESCHLSIAPSDILASFDGCDRPQIASRIHVSPNTINQRLSRMARGESGSTWSLEELVAVADLIPGYRALLDHASHQRHVDTELNYDVALGQAASLAKRLAGIVDQIVRATGPRDDSPYHLDAGEIEDLLRSVPRARQMLYKLLDTLEAMLITERSQLP